MSILRRTIAPIVALQLAAVLLLSSCCNEPSPTYAQAQPPAAPSFTAIPTQATSEDLVLEVKGNVSKVKVDKVVIVQEDRTVINSFPAVIQAPVGSGLYFWSYPNTVQAVDKGDRLEILQAPAGTLTISVKAVVIDWDKKQVSNSFGAVTVHVGTLPPGPLPPGPTPEPIPPKPDPQPAKAVIDVPGFAVLVVYESEDVDNKKLPISGGAYNLMFSQKFRDYLSATCLAEADGKNKAFRITDKDADPSKDYPYWAAALKRPRTALPWVIISSPTRGSYEGPVPATVEETWTLLKKYGG